MMRIRGALVKRVFVRSVRKKYLNKLFVFDRFVDFPKVGVFQRTCESSTTSILSKKKRIFHTFFFDTFFFGKSYIQEIIDFIAFSARFS